MEKSFLTPDQTRLDSYKLGQKVLASNFQPTHMVTFWRGGTFPACCVDEIIEYTGIEVDHVAIRTKRCKEPGVFYNNVQIFQLGYLVKVLESESKLLIVDDIFDSGLTIDAFINELTNRLGDKMPKDVRIAVVDYKPENSKVNLKPDYYLNVLPGKTWRQYCHELEGLTIEEIEEHYGVEIANVVREAYRNVNGVDL
jgi:hypoxanthine phosphoribosyltransferase